MQKVYKLFVGKLVRKRPLERPRRRWEGVIKMDVKEICETART
jgi:hypothetical protein